MSTDDERRRRWPHLPAAFVAATREHLGLAEPAAGAATEPARPARSLEHPPRARTGRAFQGCRSVDSRLPTLGRARPVFDWQQRAWRSSGSSR